MKKDSTQITWYQLLVLSSIMATFIGAGIAFAAYFHDKNIIETTKKVNEILNKMDERAEQRHSETVELLKKGFGEVLKKE